MTRVLTGVLLLVLAGMKATGQMNPAQTAEPSPSVAAGSGEQEMLRHIARLEAEARSAEAAGFDQRSMAVIYANLGGLYEELDMQVKAEGAMKRSIAFLKNGSPKELAFEIGQLATLHLQMGNTRQAEREEMRALQIREAVGDPVGIAEAEKELAGLFTAERNFKKALDYAEGAYAVLTDRPEVKPEDRIAIQYTLGFALTGVRSCDRGMALLKDAVALTRKDPGPDSLHLGYAEYLLGFGYWQCGDTDRASEWLQRGTTDMKADFGWDRAIYIDAMRQYAHFLRKTGHQDAAESAQAVVNQAEAVVDARTLTDRAAGFRSSEPR